MWPELIEKSKDGGLDVIETYVFWNLHEPVQGQVSVSSSQPTRSSRLYIEFDCFDENLVAFSFLSSTTLAEGRIW